MEYVKNDTTILYDIIGEGKPVLFLHGWGMNANFMKNSFEPIFNDFSYQRIYVNLPGMGMSHAGKEIKNSDDVIDLLEDFMNYLISDKTFMVVGESYGGYLSRGLIHRTPSRVNSAILLCPLMVPGWRKGRTENLNVMEKDDELLKSLSKEEYDSFTYMNIRLTKDVYEKFKSDIIPAFSEQEEDFLNNVFDGACSFDIETNYDKPALIITGRQDTEVGYLDQFDLAKKWSRSTYIVCNKAGHNLQIEQKEMFDSVVKNWLKSENLD